MFKLKMLQTWGEYKTGEIIELDGKFAQLLIDQKYAEKFEENPEPVVKSVGDAETLTIDGARKLFREELASALPKTDTKAARPPIETRDLILDDPFRGYKRSESYPAADAFGQFMQDVAYASEPGANVSPRLKPCKSEITIHTKAAGSDELTTVEQTFGGYLIPPGFRSELLTKGIERPLWEGARDISFTGTSMTIPALVDETRTSTLYGGIAVYTQKERSQMSQTRPEFQNVKLEPGPITGLCYVTDLMLHNYPAMGSLLSQIFADAMTFKKNNLFVKGIGGGEPVGVLNAACKVTQAKTTNQTAATINYDNIINMLSHMRDEEKAGATFLMCHAAMPQIDTLSIAVGTAGAPIARFMVDAAGVTRLNGIPIRYTEHCNALGTEGDIMLVDWRQYLIGRSTFTRSDSSIHIRFDYNQTAFRFVETIDGQMWWRTPLTLNNSFQVSPVVTLATRA